MVDYLETSCETPFPDHHRSLRSRARARMQAAEGTASEIMAPALISSRSAAATLLLLSASAAWQVSAASVPVPSTVAAATGAIPLPNGYTTAMALADGESLDSELAGVAETQTTAAAGAAGIRSAGSDAQANSADEAVHRPSGRSMLGNPPTYVPGSTFRVTATGRCLTVSFCREHWACRQHHWH